MENQVSGGAEVRRIHVIYFLSRKGHIEHPHLIRVHHLSRNGVHLRDVKRWLSELRGKEMPDSFAWSYKRRYKKGYVWQDLVDEDLITPISDNEYVLKGSEISFSTTTRTDEKEEESESVSEKQSQSHTIKEEISQEKEGGGIIQETKLENKKSRKTEYPEMDTDSISFVSDKSTLTDDSSSFSSSSSFPTKIEQDNNINHSRDHRFKVHQEEKEEHDHNNNKTETDHSIPLTAATVSSKGNNHNNTVEEVVVEKGSKQPDSDSVTSSSSSASATFNKSKSYSNGASMLFRNLISCGTASADTNDSALVTINKRKNSSQTSSLSNPIIHHIGAGAGNDPIMTKDDNQSMNIFGTSLNRHPPYASSRRSFDGVRTPSKSKKNELNNEKEIPPYKPIKGPLCSQCGKPFKPENMHAHMKSCKAMKKAMKSKCHRPAIPSASATFDDKKGSEEISSEFTFDSDPPPGYYLTPGR